MRAHEELPALGRGADVGSGGERRGPMTAKNILMLIGGEYHPWQACADIFRTCVEATKRYTVEIAEDRDALKARSISKYAAVVVYTQGGSLTREQLAGLLGFVKHGGAFIGLHSAATSWQKHPEYIDLVGGAFASHGPVTEFPVNIVNQTHPISGRIQTFRIVDELYVLTRHNPAEVDLLAAAMWQGKAHPIAYTKSYGKGRVFYLALGHDARAFEHPEFQKMAVRGIDWCLGRQPRKPLRAGVIGYGGAFNMGRMHLEGLRDAAGFEPVAVCEIDANRRRVAEQENPGIRTFANVPAMLNRSNVELVVLITPHNTHAKLAVQCLEAGRHVITEKPFCITVKEADEMIAAAKRNRRMLSVFHNRRWDGDYLALKDVIARGLIGEVFHIEACMSNYHHPGYWWRSDKKISGGAFYDWGAHICDWILGLVPSKMTEISGYFQDKRVWHDVTNEDHCRATIRFANGCSADIELSHVAAIGKRRWRILGTLGAIRSLDDKTFEVVSYKEGVRLESKVSALEWDWKAYYRNIGDHLLLGEPLAVTAESARRVIGLIETAERSSRKGRALTPQKHWA